MLNANREYLNNEGAVALIPEEIAQYSSDSVACSIIIPCYNYGKYLPEAVASALEQTFPLIEVIIVDDGSTDSYTQEVVQSFVNHARVTVIRQPNAGLSAARNTGITQAAGKYICCLDADDLLASSYIEQCVFELESRSQLGFVYSWVQLFGDEDTLWQTRNFNIDEALENNLTAVAAVYRKSDWMLAGGYDSRMAGGYEDWEFWLRLAQLGRAGKVIESPLFWHRRHGRTMTHTAVDMHAELMERIKCFNHRLFSDDNWLSCVRNYSLASASYTFPNVLANCVAVAKEIKPKKRMLIVLPWLQMGGAEILMLDILQGLTESYSFTVLTSLSDSHPLYQRFISVVDEVFHFSGQDVNQQDIAQKAEFYEFVRYIMQTREPEMILSSGSKHFYHILPNLRLDHPRLTILDLLHNDSMLGHAFTAVARSQFIDGHICVSEKIKNALIEHNVKPEKISVIHNGIDQKNIFYPRTDERNRIKEKLGLPTNRPIIGFIGRMSSEKRPCLFFDVLKRLQKNIRPFGLMLGDGPLRHEVLEYADQLFLTDDFLHIEAMPRELLWQVYEACDVVINVSSVEGMPLTVLESLATGCPVVAMQVGQLESIILSGKNGILVAENDIDELIVCLSQLLENPIELANMRKHAVSIFSGSFFNLEKMIERYQFLFSSYTRERV